MTSLLLGGPGGESTGTASNDCDSECSNHHWFAIPKPLGDGEPDTHPMTLAVCTCNAMAAGSGHPALPAGADTTSIHRSCDDGWSRTRRRMTTPAAAAMYCMRASTSAGASVADHYRAARPSAVTTRAARFDLGLTRNRPVAVASAQIAWSMFINDTRFARPRR